MIHFKALFGNTRHNPRSKDTKKPLPSAFGACICLRRVILLHCDSILAYTTGERGVRQFGAPCFRLIITGVCPRRRTIWGLASVDASPPSDVILSFDGLDLFQIAPEPKHLLLQLAELFFVGTEAVALVSNLAPNPSYVSQLTYSQALRLVSC